MEFYELNLRLFDNTQTTLLNETGNDLSPAMRTYYEKQLLKDAKPHLVYDQFGQKRPIPKGSGKTVNFRRMDPFGKAGQLVEGVTPSGNKINMKSIEATVAQYGDYVEFSDMLQLTASDPLMVETTEKLADQAGITLDSVTRDVIAGGTNVIYAPAVASDGTETAITTRGAITRLSKLRVKDIRVAATLLKRVNAKPIEGSFVAVIHPDVAHDIMEDPEFIDVVKYSNAQRIFEGEIGKLAGVRFVESTQAKIYGPAEIADGMSRLTVATAASSATASIVVEEVLAAQATCDIPVVLNGVANKITKITPGASNTTLTLGTAATAAVGDIVCGAGGGADGSAVYATMVIAKDAYGVTEIEGGGLQHIVKQLGSAGSSDPLNQRATTGWKATKTAERLTEAYMVRIEHSAGTFGAIAVAN